MATIFWLMTFVVLLVVEIVTLGLTTVWFALGAIAAFLAAYVGASVLVQIIVFLIVSVVLLIVTRPIVMKHFNQKRERTNAESLIGQQAIVISEINNLQGIGQVTVNGQEWSARNASGEKEIPVGSVVIIRSISGVKLMVEEKSMKEAK